ncbi:MAG: TonB family protein [Thermoanaerobaculia bacterium]
MPVNAAKPYDRLGAFVMFHKLDTDALGETWRAGLLEPPKMGPVLATRKLNGSRDAWAASFPSAKLFAEKITGATLAKGQKFEIIDGQPVVAWEYAGGRSLAHLVAAGVAAHNPIPVDQAIAIAEKVALALESIHSVKQEGKRLVHGAVVPQFVWISEDGDVRLAGQLLGKGLIASLSIPAIAKEAGPFVAPEVRGGAEPTKASDVYAAGAILFLTVTGQAPPDSTSGKVVDAARQAMLLHGNDPVPADVRAILEKALAPDPAARFDGPTELHKALAELLNKGEYAPTTFNLAFYLHNLLRTEMESEQRAREQESKLAVGPYLEELARPTPAPAPAAPAPAPRQQPSAPPPAASPMFGTATFEQPKKGGSKMPLVLGGLALAAVAAVAGWFFLGRKESAPVALTATAAPPPVTATVAAPVAAPVVATLPGQEQPAATDTDEETRKKAIEDEINRRLAEEMRKLQDDYNKQLKRQQDAATKAATPAQPVPAVTQQPATTQTPPAAEQPPAATTTQAAVAAPTTTTQAPVPASSVPPPAVVAPPPAAPRAVETGDFVASTELDQSPRPVRRVAPTYPPLAARQRVTGEVILSILINETGRVQEVRVLRVDKKGMGFEESAVAAVKQFTFEPGVKDGKKVKTWIPIPFVFK